MSRPPELARAIRLLADAVRVLESDLADESHRDGATRRLAAAAVQETAPLTEGPVDTPTKVVVDQIRAAAVDLLRAAGSDEAAAQAAVEAPPHASRRD